MTESRNTTGGILAALSAPFLMALGLIVWDILWKRANGSAFALNMFKCNFAAIGFAVMCCCTLGFTTNNNNNEDTASTSFITKTTYLVLSSFLGIVIGDSASLSALRVIGATRVLIAQTVKPFAAAFLGYWILNEEIHGAAYAGMILTVFGVLIVSFEQEDDDDDNSSGSLLDANAVVPTTERKSFGTEGAPFLVNELKKLEEGTNNSPAIRTGKDGSTIRGFGGEGSVLSKARTTKAIRRKRYRKGFRRGYLMALTDVLLDAYGSLLIKQHGTGMTTWTIGLIRYGFAGLFLLTISLGAKCYRSSTRPKKYSSGDHGGALEKRDSLEKPKSLLTWYQLPIMKQKAWIQVSAGVLFVTFLCPALNNFALFQISLALAITFESVTPLYALILEWPLTGSRPTLFATFGAILAVCGVVTLVVHMEH